MPVLASLIAGGTSRIGKATAEPLHQRRYQVTESRHMAAAEKELTEGIVVLRALRTVTGRYRSQERVRRRSGHRRLAVRFGRRGRRRFGARIASGDDLVWRPARPRSPTG
jgi:NAD(P)-dependent dehydrogenase (short-subunit alcohol dehydrogenase family)